MVQNEQTKEGKTMDYDEYKKNLEEFRRSIDRLDNSLTELHNARYYFDH